MEKSEIVKIHTSKKTFKKCIILHKSFIKIDTIQNKK